MSIMIPFPGGLDEPTLNQMIESETRNMYTAMGRDSLAARRHEELMYVALGYVSKFLAGDHDRGNQISRPLRPSDIVCLNPKVVAASVDPDLGHEGITGVARTVEILIAHARKFLDKQPTPPAVGMPGLQREIERFIKWKLARLAPKPTTGESYVIRGTINIDLTVDCARAKSKSVA
jgi:hypothetical protein